MGHGFRTLLAAIGIALLGGGVGYALADAPTSTTVVAHRQEGTTGAPGQACPTLPPLSGPPSTAPDDGLRQLT
jgi:hypothetical protein